MLRFLQKQPVARASVGGKQSKIDQQTEESPTDVIADMDDSEVTQERSSVTVMEKSVPKQKQQLLNEVVRMKRSGISEDACDALTRAADIGGAAVIKELVTLARMFLKDWESNTRSIDGAAPGKSTPNSHSATSTSPERPAKRARMDAQSQDDATALKGIVLKQLSATGKGKIDLVVNNDGLAYKFKETIFQVASDDIEGVLQVPHPHAHKKQTILLLNIRSAAAKSVDGSFQHLLVTFKDTEKGTVEFGSIKHTAGAFDDVKALVADGRPMREWLAMLLARATKTPSRTIAASPFACHKNAAEGFLYLLDGGLLFLTRALWLPIDEIARIEIAGGARASFDLEVEMHAEAVDKKGRRKKVVHQFMLFRELEPQVLAFIAQVHTTQQQSAKVLTDDNGNSSTHRVGAAAAQKNADGTRKAAAVDPDTDAAEDAATSVRDIADMSSDESEGEEFDPAAESEDSCAEEYDEEYNSENGDDEDEQDSEDGDGDERDSEMGDGSAEHARVFDNDDEDVEDEAMDDSDAA
eukprot:m.433611 g.433611  ORF g.433611 m.433611 type:complete len:525 (-) comp21418_c0_seq2:146-1720(-)